MVEKSPLAYLVGAYLNEDVFDFYPDVMAGVDAFVGSDPHLVEALGAEIAEILSTCSDDEVDELLRSYGVGFVRGDLGYRGWLTRIADRLRAVTGTAHPGSRASTRRRSGPIL